MINNWVLCGKPTGGKRLQGWKAPSTHGVRVQGSVSPIFSLAASSALGFWLLVGTPGQDESNGGFGHQLGRWWQSSETNSHSWFCKYELHPWKKYLAHRLRKTTKKGQNTASAADRSLARLYISISNKPRSLITRLLIFYHLVTDFEFKFPSFCLYLKNNNNHFPSITNNNTDPQTECWSCNSIWGFGCHSLIPRAVLLLFMTSAETLDWIAALYLIRDYVLFCMQYPELKIAPFQSIIGKRQQSLNIYSNWYFLYLF